MCLIMLIIGLINPKWALLWIVEERQKRKNVLKYFGSGFIILFILACCITSNNTNKTEEKVSVEEEVVSIPTDSNTKSNANKSSSSTDKNTSVKETTSPERTYASIYNIQEKNVTNGTKTKVLGKRGQAYFDKNTLTNESLAAFYNDVIKNSGYNYYTLIDSSNFKKGIVFLGCLSPCNYGYIDETGGITNASSIFDVAEYNSSSIK